MATYISRRQRSQRLYAAVAIATLIAAPVGYIAGRSSVLTVAERVAQVRDSSKDLAIRVSALTIEYEQTIQGRGDSVAAGVVQPLVGITSDLDQLLGKAKWVGPDQTARVRRLVKAVGTSAEAKVDIATFEQVTASAAEALRTLAP